MMTSSNGQIFHVTGNLCGDRWIPPAQRPVTRSFDVFFDLLLNKRLSNQWWGWWFETPSRPLWRHCNVYLFLRNVLRSLCRFFPMFQGRWVFSDMACQALGFMTMLTFVASVMSLGTISFNRYIHICQHHRFSTMYTWRNTGFFFLGWWPCDPFSLCILINVLCKSKIKKIVFLLGAPYNFKAETETPPFSRRHLRINVIEWQLFYFDLIFTGACSRWCSW